jgi:hypothetical protein
MPRHERAAKSAAIALAAQLDSEMSFEERERMERSGMGIGNGLNKGEDQLFGAPAGHRRIHLTARAARRLWAAAPRAWARRARAPARRAPCAPRALRAAPAPAP